MTKLIVPILSGGGTKLAAHIGILDAIYTLGIDFQHIVGVSGGSIVAALHSSGMPLEQIKQLALDTNFKKFRGFSLITLIFHGGLSSGNAFERWIDTQLQGKQFKDINKDLHILATDVNGGGPIVFNKQNSPDLKVSKAVRFSLAFSHIRIIYWSTVQFCQKMPCLKIGLAMALGLYVLG